jgi:AcrR family transcriptional regulator
MVRTPWGDSDSLRARKLSPGPGGAREEVERNQRRRLYGALVASLAKKGYEATTVADLTDVSGVSSRTFYGLFADKKACFLAALEAMLEVAIAYAAGVGKGSSADALGGEGWEKQARRGFKSFAEMVVAQPAAARMGLIEAYAVGPEALAPLEAAVEGFEWLARQTLAQSPERAEIPAEMVSAHVGAMREIVSTRLREGREAELPGLMDELWGLIRSYRPPPEPLRVAGRAPKARVESLEAHDHAERALRAFAVVVAEKGYAAATVDAVVGRAAMSATTFYANFGGKEDTLMAAIDSAGAQMIAAWVPSFRRAGDWPRGVRAGLGALFNFLASRPALAQLMLVEVYAAGPAAVGRRAEAMEPLRALMAEGYERRPEVPGIAVEVIAGGIYTLAYRRIREKGPPGLPGLAPLCTYIALAPFIGAEEACAVANGDGRGRSVT